MPHNITEMFDPKSINFHTRHTCLDNWPCKVTLAYEEELASHRLALHKKAIIIKVTIFIKFLLHFVPNTA